jgi:hypothetical protein
MAEETAAMPRLVAQRNHTGLGTGPGDASAPTPSLAPTPGGSIPVVAEAGVIPAYFAANLASWSLVVGHEHVDAFSQGEIFEDEFVLAGGEGSRPVSLSRRITGEAADEGIGRTGLWDFGAWPCRAVGPRLRRLAGWRSRQGTRPSVASAATPSALEIGSSPCQAGARHAGHTTPAHPTASSAS